MQLVTQLEHLGASEIAFHLEVHHNRLSHLLLLHADTARSQELINVGVDHHVLLLHTLVVELWVLVVELAYGVVQGCQDVLVCSRCILLDTTV